MNGPTRTVSLQQLIECGSIDFKKAVVAASDHLAMLPEHADSLIQAKAS
jgi:hypothetical protein